MICFQVVILSVLANAARCENTSFPRWFKFGAATSAGQTEGAWNISDKAETIWDHFARKPGKIADGTAGDVNTNSYYLYQRDVDIATEMGLDFYRFSISWARLLPNGFSNRISEDGKKFYNNLIDELLKNNIEPLVTIHHFDLPQSLQDLGGWINPLITDWFADYARIVFTLFGDRVKTWITINEPLIMCDFAFNTGIVAPGVVKPNLGGYYCIKNVLIAHAKAYRIYDQEFKAHHHGKLSIPHILFWFEPLTPEDMEITELVREYGIGRFTHPIYSKQGGWPPAIEKAVAETSKRLGYPRSKLPEFTLDEIELVKGTYDFVALNHYSTFMVRKACPGEQIGSWFAEGAPDLGAIIVPKADWMYNPNSSYFSNYPEGLRRLVGWLRQQYGDMEIMITEIGYLSQNCGLDDQERLEFHKGFLQEILTIINEDKANITGYTVWSLMDVWEWMSGYTSKFGLYEVDFSSPDQTRVARKSAKYYANVIKYRKLDVPVL